MLIFKEELPVDTLDFRRVKLPFVSPEEAARHILKLDIQYGVPCMWYQADLNMDKESDESIENEYVIIAIGTGHPWPEGVINRDKYLGTLLLMGDTLVLHYFIRSLNESEEA